LEFSSTCATFTSLIGRRLLKLPESDEGRVGLFALLIFVLTIAAAYWIPLFESTDPRYAEIAREMLKTGNWLEPELNGIRHFHKPPAVYWTAAAGMKLFGVNAFGARFFSAAAAALTLIITAKTARLITKKPETGFAAALVLSSSVLFAMISRVVSTDIYVTLCSVICVYLIFRAAEGNNSLAGGLLLGLAAGAGFMFKGPVVLLFAVLPAVAVSLYAKDFRRIYRPVFFFPALAVFCVTALPWFVYTGMKYDGMLNYFIGYQLVERASSNTFNRAEPFYFYGAVFILLMGQWFIFGIAGLRKLRMSVTLFLIIPFTVLQLSVSKLASYILPMFPLLSVSAANYLLSVNSRYAVKLAHVFTGATIAVFAAAGFAVPFMKPYFVWFLLPALISAVLYLLLFMRLKGGKGALIASAVVMLIITNSVYWILPSVDEYVKGYRKLAERSLEYKGVELACYKCFLPSVSFYRREKIAMVMSKERELQFEKDYTYKEFYYPSQEDADNYFSDRDRVLVVMRPHLLEEMKNSYGLNCSEKFKAGRHSLYLCER
jgi:4-amino-4-deoxy-L-arabinose transferase